MERYKEPSQDIVDRIRKCFRGSSEFTFEFKTKKDGYYISAAQMYSYVEFAQGKSVLQAYMEIARLLGVSDGDEISRYHTQGCETCDYGSNYELELRFW